MRRERSGARGIGLIEALLSMLALSLALSALLHLQTLMHDSAEHDRLRLEALAHVQSLHEGLRQGGTTPDDLLPADLPVGDGLTWQTRDLASDMPTLRQRRSVVRWTAPRGWPGEIELATLLPSDPVEADRLGAAVLLDRAPAPRDEHGLARALPRHALIPDSAVRLGDGRSAWQPRADLPAVWLIDERSGAVLALCGGLTTLPDGQRRALDCVAIGGLLISGVVRFSTDSDQPGSAQAESPLSPPLPLSLALRTAKPGDVAPKMTCTHDAPTTLPAPDVLHGPGVVRYLCAVAGSGSPPRWSGQLDLVPQGWTIGSANGAPGAPPVFRVCRYSADHDHNGRIDDREHPPIHLDVAQALGDQNFLVVRGSASCPRDLSGGLPGSPGMGWLDDSTQPHQPP